MRIGEPCVIEGMGSIEWGVVEDDLRIERDLEPRCEWRGIEACTADVCVREFGLKFSGYGIHFCGLVGIEIRCCEFGDYHEPWSKCSILQHRLEEMPCGET